jgi:hypothetical protein|uniref:Rho termination factor-like N-terminal domain-containing protein n=1 Tax=viral metagenome TaxID=1070528 RepID=A0A6C0AKU3_9ZZZZ
MSKKSSKMSLRSLSITPQKTRKKKKKNPLKITDIKYLDLHVEAALAQKKSQKEAERANNKRNNDMREELIEFIFRMNDTHPFLEEDTSGRWEHWFKQSLKIKKELQAMYKLETGEKEDGKFHIRQRGGSYYKYDFAVRISNKNNTKRTFIPLEYKHQSSLGKLPQFYQKGNVAKPFFSYPYHEYYFDKGLPEVNKVIGVDLTLDETHKKTYSTAIGKSVWTVEDWDTIKSDAGYTKSSPVNKQLKFLRENYELSPKGKSESYKKRQKVVTKTICDYLKLMKESNFINLDLINEVEGILLESQKPLDHNKVPKDKIYMLCEYKNGVLSWKTAQYDKDDYKLIKDPQKVVVDPENLLFPTKSGKYVSIRLRWQNVSGMCNPTWQFKLKEPKKPKKTKKRKSSSNNNTRKSRSGPTVKKLKTIAKENGITGISKLKKSELIERLTSNNIQFK